MKKTLILIAIPLLILAACSGGSDDSDEPEAAADPTPTVEIVAPANDDAAAQDAADPGAAAQDAPTTDAGADAAPAPATYNGPDWTSLPLTDVRTGTTFTFADFAGRTVYVQGMAIWCSVCHRAHEILRDNVVDELGDDFVFVSLNVEAFASNSAMQRYVDDDNFDWTFAIITPELLAELTRAFGAGISTPPVGPHFIIGPDGTPTNLLRGTPSPDSLIAQLQDTQGA